MLLSISQLLFTFPKVILMILRLYWCLGMLTGLQASKASSELGCIFLPSGTSWNSVNQILIKINELSEIHSHIVFNYSY